MPPTVTHDRHPAPLNERGAGDDATNETVRLWQCENSHWWMQSVGFGWMPIDPGVVAGEAPTVTVTDG